MILKDPPKIREDCNDPMPDRMNIWATLGGYIFGDSNRHYVTV